MGPFNRHNLHLAINHCRMMGVWDAFKHGLGNLLIEPSDDGFDRRYGTDTGTVMSMRFDEKPQPGEEVQSFPTHPRVLAYILKNLPARPEEFTFVDFGCGKGRALLCASEFPFKKIIGVEWSSDLSDIARRNAQIFRSPRQKCTCFEVRCMDVLDFEFPDDNVLLYMYNPFGPELTRQVFAKLRRDRGGDPHRLLMAFSGLGRREDAFICDCFKRNGLEILSKQRTLAGWSSWMLGELGGSSDEGGASVHSGS